MDAITDRRWITVVIFVGLSIGDHFRTHQSIGGNAAMAKILAYLAAMEIIVAGSIVFRIQNPKPEAQFIKGDTIRLD